MNGKPMVNPKNQLLTAPGLNDQQFAETRRKTDMNGGAAKGPRPSTSSTITSDYFSMNSNKENEQILTSLNGGVKDGTAAAENGSKLRTYC